MKVLGISCSLRKGSNTEILVEEALAGAREMGRQMGSLIRQGFKFAEEYDRPLYQYVKEKYGLSSPPFG